jgi:hypothetical protein
MRMPAGWNIRVTTFDSEGNPQIVRNFLAYESDKEGAIELVRKRVPVNEGELAEAVAECQSASKFDPRSASNFDPLERRVRAVALAPSELVGVAETARARIVG